MPAQSSICREAPIAVFDSGLGGLTVVRALRAELPYENYIYYGDTARVPFGNKSPETVARFSAEICDFLMHFQPKCIIAACHTVSASAIPALRDRLPVPVLGVVEPSAALAAAASERKIVAVLGTEATIASGAYERAVRRHDPDIRVIQQSCPLLVPIIEEGRTCSDPLTQQAIHDYLNPIKQLAPDVVLLGCTHYPVLKSGLQQFFGEGVTMIDAGEAVARITRRQLQAEDLLSRAASTGTVQCYVSDYPQRFSQIGSRFLGEPLQQVTRACAERWSMPHSGQERAASA